MTPNDRAPKLGRVRSCDECDKCGWKDIAVKLAKGERWTTFDVPEGLECGCKRCGYSWTAPTKDAAPDVIEFFRLKEGAT